VCRHRVIGLRTSPPARVGNRSWIDDIALDTVLCQHSMDPEQLEPGLLDDDQRRNCFLRASTRSWSDRSGTRRPPILPADTECFYIFTRVPGDSEATIHVVRLNSNETKIARRSVRIGVSVSVLSALLRMVASNW
jgi:hypothetical protein